MILLSYWMIYLKYVISNLVEHTFFKVKGEMLEVSIQKGKKRFILSYSE